MPFYHALLPQYHHTTKHSPARDRSTVLYMQSSTLCTHLHKARHRAVLYKPVKDRLQQVDDPTLQPSLIDAPHLRPGGQGGHTFGAREGDTADYACGQLVNDPVLQPSLIDRLL